MSVSVPDVTPDDDTLGAALKYAAAGWYVVPVSPRDRKNPGSVVGKGWQHQSSRDTEQIVAWFAGTDYLLALHVGRSGAVVFDVDHVDGLPEMLRTYLMGVTCPPHQSSRPDQPGRGHYVYAQPAGRSIGNSSGRLGKGWGEVRGKNGVILVTPSRHKDEANGARYEWAQTGRVPEMPTALAELLPDASVAVDAATDTEVQRFVTAHTTARAPGKLRGPLTKFEQHIAEGASRHESLTSVAAWAMREAMAGFYTAESAVEALQAAFITAAGRSRDGRERVLAASSAKAEADSVIAWAIAQAEFEGVEAATAVTKKEERTSVTNRIGDTKKEETSAPPPVVDPVVFHGLLGEICQTVDAGNHTEADPVGVLVTLMAGAGALMGMRPHVQIASTRHPLLIWPLLFGSTGAGRKGESYSTARLFLSEVPDPGSGHRPITVSGLSSGEGLIEYIRDPVDEEDQGGSLDKELLVVEPEFATVMARAKREGSTLAGVLRQAWDGGALTVLNRKALRASSSHVAIVGHVTPREFRIRLAESEMSGGTYNRFLPIYVDRAKRLPLPELLPGEVIQKLGLKLTRAVYPGVANEIGLITLDPDARKLWANDLYDEFTGADEEDQIWTEFTRRAAPYCLRISGLHAALDGRDAVSPGDLTAAGALVRYAIASARYVLDRQARDPRLDRIRRAVGGSADGLARTEISGLFSRNLPKAALDLLLEELVAGGEFERIEVRSGGRPAVRYRRVVSSFFVIHTDQESA